MKLALPTDEQIQSYLSLKSENPPFNGTLMGGASPSMASILSKLHTDAYNDYERRYTLRNLASILNLTNDWIDDAFQNVVLCPLAFVASIYDAWIFYNHAKSEGSDLVKEQAETYFTFFKWSLQQPDIWAALQSLNVHYYNHSDSKKKWKNHPINLIHQQWNEGVRNKELNRDDRELTIQERNHDAELERLVYMLSRCDEDTARESILNDSTFIGIVSQAALNNDLTFFKALGRAIEHKPHIEKAVSLYELVNMSQFKSGAPPATSSSPWCRRHWVSRCFWLTDFHSLHQAPLNLEDSQISKLCSTENKDLRSKKLTRTTEAALAFSNQNKWESSSRTHLEAPSWDFLTLNCPVFNS